MEGHRQRYGRKPAAKGAPQIEASFSIFKSISRRPRSVALPAIPRNKNPIAGRLEGLDGLRLLAVLAVVLFHFAFRGAAGGLTNASIPALAPVAKYGYLGVHLFFVISGFVIAYSSHGRRAVAFGIARFSRIYPTFIVCMSATTIVILLFGAPRFETSFGQWAANLFVASELFDQPFVDGAYWSILYELLFYGWMFVLLAIFPASKIRMSVVCFGWLALSAVNELVLHSDLARRIFLTDASAFFVAGIMLYQIHAKAGGRSPWVVLGVAGIGSALQAVMTAPEAEAAYDAQFSRPVIAACAIIGILLVALATSVRIDARWSRALVVAGGITYPLYLLHQNIGYIILNLAEGTAPAPVLIVIASFTLSLVSLAVWRFVDRPLNRATANVLSKAAAALGIVS